MAIYEGFYQAELNFFLKSEVRDTQRSFQDQKCMQSRFINNENQNFPDGIFQVQKSPLCVMYSITITEKSIINLKMKIIENFNEIYATEHGTIFAGGNAVVVFKTSLLDTKI